MSWEAWILTIVFALTILASPRLVEQERKPYSANEVVIAQIFYFVLLVLVLRLGLR